MKKYKSIAPKEAYDMLSSGVIWGKAFTSYFGVLPSSKNYLDINPKQIETYIDDNLGALIAEKFKYERYERKGGKRSLETIYLLSNQVIIHIEKLSMSVDLLYSLPESKFIVDLDQQLKSCCKLRKGKEIYLTVLEMGITLKPIFLQRLKVDLNENYNEDLVESHQKIISLLGQRNKSELFLFHGLPGTGKSTYIRHLVYNLKKKVIFLPPNVAGKMDSPEIAGLVINNQNSVIVIEDAEELIVSRNQESNSAISMLLNLTDGLLGYCLGIQFICTFNTSLGRIDPALLRKGRLSFLYEFKPLSERKTNNLITKLFGDICTNAKSMTLADIYNLQAPNHHLTLTSPLIGFSNNHAN